MTIQKMENVIVEILRMNESSGNRQVYIRVKRTDCGDTSLFSLNETLEYECHQTKHGLELEECIERAMFSVGFLLRFFGHKYSDIKFVNFTEDELIIANKAMKLRFL